MVSWSYSVVKQKKSEVLLYLVYTVEIYTQKTHYVPCI